MTTTVYKSKIHIPTRDFAFVEIEVEGTIQQISDIYNESELELKPKEGLNQNEWARVRDNYVKTNKIEIDEFEQLSTLQKYFISQLKKARKSE